MICFGTTAVITWCLTCVAHTAAVAARAFLCLSRFPLASINKWNSPGRCCPICHVVLPPELLKLYYEPQKDAPDDAVVVGCAPDCGTQDVETIAAEVKKLQRKLMKSNKVGREYHLSSADFERNTVDYVAWYTRQLLMAQAQFA